VLTLFIGLPSEFFNSFSNATLAIEMICTFNGNLPFLARPEHRVLYPYPQHPGRVVFGFASFGIRAAYRIYLTLELSRLPIFVRELKRLQLLREVNDPVGLCGVRSRFVRAHKEVDSFLAGLGLLLF
jgi:hypothetical protein